MMDFFNEIIRNGSQVLKPRKVNNEKAFVGLVEKKAKRVVINFNRMNDYLNTNLKSLIEKVHDEGIEKANEEAQQIIAAAKQQSAELIKKAEESIAKMEAQASDEVKRRHESLNSELKAVAQQSISSIKNELAAVISGRAISQEISDALHEKEFLQKIILTVLQKWNVADNHFQLELLLNETDQAQLKDFFEQKIKKELVTELEIVIDNKIKSGFKIGVKNENYYVSFSDEDFENFFKGYLRKKTLEWIYETKENEHK